MAIDVGIAEAALKILYRPYTKRAQLLMQMLKSQLEHYTLQEVGKLNILLDAAILLLDEAAEYLDELDQLQTVTDEQVAKLQFWSQKQKSMPMMRLYRSLKTTRARW